MKITIVIVLALAFCGGCVLTETGLGDSNDQVLRDDESCDILYSMVEVCVATGATDRNSQSCEATAEGIRKLNMESLDADDDSADFMQQYCLRHCNNAINGLPAPRVSEVCLETI